MPDTLRLAITADLHLGIRKSGDEATRLLMDFLRADPPDLLVLAGDQGAGDEFAACLKLFQDLPCQKALVPGNHDIWVEENDPRGDSLRVYRESLPSVSAACGFHCLDNAPLFVAEASLAIVGSINWYDYSWSLEKLQKLLPDWQERLYSKRFTRGRHNDARFIRWPLDDRAFTAQVVATLERHLQQAVEKVADVIVITHHPPFHGLSFPRPGPETIDGLLWDAFSGNRSVEKLLQRFESHIRLAFCGHTHRERESTLGPIRGVNIGGDYHFKRLVTLDWPSGRTEVHVFGDPAARAE